MQQRQNGSRLQWFDQYQASKTVLFWACAGSVVLATVVGFSWGGWVTGGTAQEMAEQSAAQARQELAAVVCVDRFMAEPDMHAQLTALKGIERSYQRGKFVEDGGWAIMPVGSNAEASTPVSSSDQRKAAGLCAEALAQQEIPAAAGRAEQINEATTVAQ
jgi:pimeloyl-ACP methyl ester carboxylesterase